MGQAFGQTVTIGYGAARGLRNLIAGLILTSGYAVADEVVIAALGDSLTAGYGLPQGDGFVPQLDAWLEGQGLEVDLRNAGVSGDTTAGGLSRVDWTLTPDVDAMIVTLGGNDYLRGLDPAASRANLRGILEAAQARDIPVMLIGITAGANYGADFKAQFDGMYVDLAAEFETVFEPDFFAGLLAKAGTQDGVAALMQADGIHPNKTGVDAIVDRLGPAVLTFAQAVN